ncbi:hypothetical protein GCM10023322_69650 [Rugosimonospora acidiphila]|uniref:DUF2267 domain-containing protein n=1 Tax=Rugosimonospora acidiphila TaxID=556531 RepID=A0ABP9SND0_9ACTN
MDYDEFIQAVAVRMGASRNEANAMSRATLVTLSERISGGEASDLAEQLPPRLRDWMLPTAENAERFGLAEFMRRVGVHAELPPDRAQPGVAAVLATLREAVDGKDFADTLTQLPKEYWTVVEPTP